MSLALLRDAVRAEMDTSAIKPSRKSLRQLSQSEKQAVRAMRRQMRGVNAGKLAAKDEQNDWWF
jgi:hypothetical protein